MKPFLRKSRSRWEKLLLAVCAFFWAGCDNSTDPASASISSGSSGGISSSSARTPSSSADSAAGSSSSVVTALSSSSVSLDQCTLEYSEEELQQAVDDGSITDKSVCNLGDFIALYGSPAVFDSLAALDARTTLVYDPGVGCFRCPNEASSSSKENDSSSSAISSSAENPASSSSFGSVAPLYGVPMDDNS